mgnify:CR=1 FL=1
MLFAYRIEGHAVEPLPMPPDLAEADWIDLYCPEPDQVAAVEALGLEVPTLEDMEEIEVSNRLYRTGDVEVLTVGLPGFDVDKRPLFGPVAFLLTPEKMITVRYHDPRPFTTFPRHADSNSAGCGSHLHLFLGLVEEIVARLADLLEAVGRSLDAASHRLFDPKVERDRDLSALLREVGSKGEDLARYRLALLSMERALTVFGLGREGQVERALRPLVKANTRDIQALVVHADFLSGRVAHVTDVILGMVTLEQTATGQIVSVVAMLFLPPTLVASVYGMNFANLPGLDHPQGYLIATGLMLFSVVGSFLYFRWKGWL